MKIRGAHVGFAERAIAIVSVPYAERAKFSRTVQKGARIALENEETGEMVRGIIRSWKESVGPGAYKFEIEMQATNTCRGAITIKRPKKGEEKRQ